MGEEEAVLLQLIDQLCKDDYDWAALEATEPPATLEEYLAMVPNNEESTQ